MRIASYNIMSGGFDDYKTSSTTPQRLPLLQEAIKKLDADIVGLVDTFRWDEIYTEANLKELFGYKYAHCINLNDERLKQLGHDNGLTILSNVEIKAHTVRLHSRDAIIARVQGPDLLFKLAIVYLDDISEDTRLKQIQALHSLIDSEEPLVLMGDLNSISDTERTHAETAFGEFVKQNSEIGAKIQPVVDDMLRAETTKQLEVWGLQDAGEKQQLATMPTALFPAKVDKPFLRVDYCFYSPSLSVSGFNVPYDEIFQKASDHFPIVFDIIRHPQTKNADR